MVRINYYAPAACLDIGTARAAALAAGFRKRFRYLLSKVMFNA